MKFDIITKTQKYELPTAAKLLLIAFGGGSGSFDIYGGWKGGVSVDILSDVSASECQIEIGDGAPKNVDQYGGNTRILNAEATGGKLPSFGEDATGASHGMGAIGKYMSKSSFRYTIFDSQVIEYIEENLPELIDDVDWIDLKNIVISQSDYVSSDDDRDKIEYDLTGPYKPGAAGVVSTCGCSGAVFLLWLDN